MYLCVCMCVCVCVYVCVCVRACVCPYAGRDILRDKALYTIILNKACKATALYTLNISLSMPRAAFAAAAHHFFCICMSQLAIYVY